MDLRESVLYNCSQRTNCSYLSNGLKLYYSMNCSWGFADQFDVVDRSWGDENFVDNPSSRLCWHTIRGYDGYRCGSIYFNYPHNGSLYQRVVWHMD